MSWSPPTAAPSAITGCRNLGAGPCGLFSTMTETSVPCLCSPTCPGGGHLLVRREPGADVPQDALGWLPGNSQSFLACSPYSLGPVRKDDGPQGPLPL